MCHFILYKIIISALLFIADFTPAASPGKSIASDPPVSTENSQGKHWYSNWG